MGHMNVLDGFYKIDVHQAPQKFGVNHVLDLAEERCVAKHMADGHDATALLGEPQDVRALLPCLGDGFFQKHVIAHLQRRHRRHVVEVVGHRDNDCIGEFRDIKDVLPGSELVGGVDRVLRRVPRESNRDRLGNAHDVKLGGEVQGVSAIDISPVAGTGHNGRDRPLRLPVHWVGREFHGTRQNIGQCAGTQHGACTGGTDRLQPGAAGKGVFHG